MIPLHYARSLVRKTTPQTPSRFLSVTLSSRNVKSDVPYKDNIKDKAAQTQISIPKEADVVVIGGGSIGCSTLYHLTKLGITNAILLESHQLTAGTTWHTAGLVWRLRPSDTEIQLLSRTRELMLSLEGETGVNPGWVNNGGLFIASTKERLTEYKRLATIGKVHNVETFTLGPSETKKLYPLMNIEDVYGTLYSPGDGTIEPSGYCTALTRAATRAGATVIEQCPVTAIETASTLYGGTRVTQVQTPFGSIKTNRVVNATGAWAPYVTKMVGVDIPLVVFKHAYVVTEKIPGIERMPNIRDHDSSLYMRLQGDGLSVGGYENNPIFIEKINKDFGFTLFDLDWNVFSTHIEGAVNRIPILGKTGIKSTVCGPESFTPDHKPLLGEDPNVAGFFHCCGFNSAGMMLSGGCGEQMSKWLINGRPDFDMFGYDIRRFRPFLNSNKTWALERSHEAYAKNYSIVFPHDEPLAGRGQLKSPIHELLTELGCVYQERHGYERPGWFNSIPCPTKEYDWYGAYDKPLIKDNEYKSALTKDYTFDFPSHHDSIRDTCIAARSCAALFDMSYFGKFYLSGPDAQKAVDWIFSANMQRDVGCVVYTCMLNKRGYTEADLTVSILDGKDTCDGEPKFEGKGFYLAVGGAVVTQNWAHIMAILRQNNWNVSIVDWSHQMSLLSLQGPLSRTILQEIADFELSNDSFPFSTHKMITVAGHKVRALRLSFVGELGWELHTPSQSTVSVFKALQEVGKKYGLVNGGYRAMDSLSAEKGYVHWHADLRADDTPLEAGLGFACKLKTSTQFLGREALEKQKKEGLKKKMVTLTLEDRSVPLWGLEGIVKDGSIVGFVRRAEFAFHLGTSIAYGYVKKPCGGTITKDFLSEGKWEIESAGIKHPAKLHLQHPFDPKNARLKGLYGQNS